MDWCGFLLWSWPQMTPYLYQMGSKCANGMRDLLGRWGDGLENIKWGVNECSENMMKGPVAGEGQPSSSWALVLWLVSKQWKGFDGLVHIEFYVANEAKVQYYIIFYIMQVQSYCQSCHEFGINFFLFCLLRILSVLTDRFNFTRNQSRL